METINIYDRQSLETYLSGDGYVLGRGIAHRAALRSLPSLPLDQNWLAPEAILLFRALVISGLKLDDYYQDVARSVDAALIKLGDPGFTPKVAVNGPARMTAAAALKTMILNNSSFVQFVCDAVDASAAFYGDKIWAEVRRDWEINKNNDFEKLDEVARLLSASSLWAELPPVRFSANWSIIRDDLHQIDPNFIVWTNWFERKVMGQDSAFDIPGDKGRIEDKKILRRLAEATDEDFWGKGHEYVNATLKGWLDEARARVAPPVEVETEIAVPSQEPHAIAYGVNKDWMLDRLPHSDQTHLRDLPNQRRAYADLRETALELQEEGQRLGPRLQPRIERAVASLPEKFEDAEAWPVWRDFNALRRLLRAHQIAFDNPEPDTAKLEPVIAETLGGLLDIYNNFAFADDGLRAKDENRISPQERASAEAEAVAASPVIEAIRIAQSIATDLAREDIIADAENIELPVGDPYGAQVLDQANRTRRNWLAGAFEGARRAMANPKIVGKAIAIGVVGGAAGVVGKVAMTGMVGLEYGPLLQFIATNAAILQNYAAVAFSSYPQLNDLIERISVMWKTRKSSSS